MTIAVAFALLLLIGVLTLVSYVDRVYQELGKFLSREFQDNIDVFEQKIEPKLRVSRGRAAVTGRSAGPSRPGPGRGPRRGRRASLPRRRHA